MDDGTVISNQNIKQGKQPQRPLNPQKSNYTFKGWYLIDQSGNYQAEFQFQTGITEDTLVYAKFEPNRYKITYNVLSGTYNTNPNEYVYGEGIKQLADPYLGKHVFDGWYRDTKFTNKITSIQPTDFGDITLYAKFSKLKYSVEYILNGGINNQLNPNEYTSGDQYKLYEPFKDGYTFGGWYEDEEYKFKRTQIDPENSMDFKLYALWIPKVYNIFFQSAGGTLQQYQEQYNTRDGLSSLPVPKREGYEFLGWCSDKQLGTQVTSIEKGTKGDITLYAQWRAKEIQVEYNLDGGTNNPSNPSTYKIGQEPFKLLDPQRTNYKFFGWFDSNNYENRVYYLDGVHSEINLYAKWVYVGQSSVQSEATDKPEQQIQQVDNTSNKRESGYIILTVQLVQVLLISAAVVIYLIYKKSRQQCNNEEGSFEYEETQEENLSTSDENFWALDDEFKSTVTDAIAKKDSNKLK